MVDSECAKFREFTKNKNNDGRLHTTRMMSSFLCGTRALLKSLNYNEDGRDANRQFEKYMFSWAG